MPDSVCKIDVEIKNRNGLHMRPAMLLVDIASRFTSDIKISNEQTSADAKSIMQVTMLAAAAGTKLTVTAKGHDCNLAVEAIKELIEVRMFDEEGRQETVQAG
ncbi:MAG: HPr family phosphocarrier protein [Phycisphaerae bacterium]